MRFKEMEADFGSVYRDPISVTNFESLEASAAKLLTRELFLLFRDVLHHASLFNVTDARQTAGHDIYKVMKYRISGKVWHVTHYPTTNEFRCSCQMFESFGLPCPHVVALLVFLNSDELSKSIVLDRWTKAAKDRFHGLQGDTSNFWDSHVIGRYVWLLEGCKELCNLGYITVDYFYYVRDKVGEIVLYLKNKNGNQNDNAGNVGVQGLRDPMNLRRKVGRTHNSTSSLKIKHTTKRGACRVPGHNRLTCPLLKEPCDVGDHMYRGVNTGRPVPTKASLKRLGRASPFLECVCFLFLKN